MLTVQCIQEEMVAKAWAPNIILSNMSMAYFDQGNYAARELFPVVPVALPAAYYIQWKKGDLARRAFKTKPAFGRVKATNIGWKGDTYSCEPKQIIAGLDRLEVQKLTASGAPVDPRATRARYVAEQVNTELDCEFADKYFKADVWSNQFEGKSSSPSESQFLQFDNANSDPVSVIDEMKATIKRQSRRSANKMGIGYDVFRFMKKHPLIVERVKYGGTSANPAVVTLNAMAEIFEVDKVVCFDATYNRAQEGQDDDMQFICDPKGILLVHAPDAPALDEPSAGYTFAWELVGDGTWIAMDQFEGERGTHSDYQEGLIATDMKITAQDCAVYLKNAVS